MTPMTALRLLEASTHLDMALCSEIVDFCWADFRDDFHEASTVSKVSIMELHG